MGNAERKREDRDRGSWRKEMRPSIHINLEMFFDDPLLFFLREVIIGITWLRIFMWGRDLCLLSIVGFFQFQISDLQRSNGFTSAIVCRYASGAC